MTSTSALFVFCVRVCMYVCKVNSFRFHENFVRVTYAIRFSIQRQGNVLPSDRVVGKMLLRDYELGRLVRLSKKYYL